MSPGFMNGMNPSSRCRSDPQMQVEVMRMIASRRLRIFGSGTFSTFTLYGAHQTSAFMTTSFEKIRNPKFETVLRDVSLSGQRADNPAENRHWPERLRKLFLSLQWRCRCG